MWLPDSAGRILRVADDTSTFVFLNKAGRSQTGLLRYDSPAAALYASRIAAEPFSVPRWISRLAIHFGDDIVDLDTGLCCGTRRIDICDHDALDAPAEPQPSGEIGRQGECVKELVALNT